MKASDYYRQYAQNPTDLNLAQIARDFFLEVESLVDARRGHSDAAVEAVVREQEQKWRAFCELVNRQSSVNKIRKDGFDEWMKVMTPDFYDELQDIRSTLSRSTGRN